MVTKLASALALAAVLTAGAATAAESRQALPQLSGVTTNLGNNASAQTYWVDEADGIHVVTTIDTVDGNAAPVPARHSVARFSALILPGQSQVISVPGPAGAQPQALRIRRLSNRQGAYRIEVDRITPSEVQAERSNVPVVN